jgi:hypothetical protein
MEEDFNFIFHKNSTFPFPKIVLLDLGEGREGGHGISLIIFIVSTLTVHTRQSRGGTEGVNYNISFTSFQQTQPNGNISINPIAARSIASRKDGPLGLEGNLLPNQLTYFS